MGGSGVFDATFEIGAASFPVSTPAFERLLTGFAILGDGSCGLDGDGGSGGGGGGGGIAERLI